MSAHDNEPIDPYAAPRVASTPESERVRIVSMEAEHVAIVRNLRRSAIMVAAMNIAVGVMQLALGVSAIYVYATERPLTWATFVPSGVALMAMFSLLGAMFVFTGVSALRAPGSPAGNGVSLFRGGWRFTTAGVSAFACAFFTIDWFLPMIGAGFNKPPAYATVTILLAAAAAAAFATIAFFGLAIPARRLLRRLTAANLPLESMVDDEGRVVVRLPASAPPSPGADQD